MAQGPFMSWSPVYTGVTYIVEGLLGLMTIRPGLDNNWRNTGVIHRRIHRRTVTFHLQRVHIYAAYNHHTPTEVNSPQLPLLVQSKSHS